MTEDFLSRSRLTRSIESLAAAALVSVAGFWASSALAGPSAHAAPSSTPAAASAARPEAGGPVWTDLSAGQRFSQPLTRKCVHARGRRGRYCLMTTLTKNRYHL